MRLFEIAKVGCVLDGVSHSLEKRRGEDVKVLTLTLKIAPFTAQHAATMPDGVKPTLFNLNSGDPKQTLRRVDFALGVERQQLHVFASPDTDAPTFVLDQVKVHGTYARVQKDRNGFDFVLRATFGPVGRDELEWIQQWLLTQTFVTFQEAEPLLDMEDDGEDPEPTNTEDHTPMWDDDVPVTQLKDGEVFTTDTTGKRISDARVIERWASRKAKLPSSACRVIDALLIHGDLNASQLRSAAKMAPQTVHDAVHKLKKLGLINKTRDRYTLKTLV